MKLPRRTFLHLAAGAAALPAVSRFAWAQVYPTRPVRIIVTEISAASSASWPRAFPSLDETPGSGHHH